MQVFGSARDSSIARICKFTFTALSSLALLTVFLITATSSAHAQFGASLRGTVTDAKGAVVPGATVTVEDKGTGEKHQSTSNDSGIYTFNALPGSHFKLTVERSGFKKKEVEEVSLIPDQRPISICS